MLRLHEELALLALDEKRGVFRADYLVYGLAGALFADLLLEKRIAVEETKKKLVDVCDATPVGDPLLDNCLQKFVTAKRRTNATNWISRFAGMNKLQHRVAEGLCAQGILRADRATVFGPFTRNVYPEVDPKPEQELRARVERALFTESNETDARTAVLIALADNAGILHHAFGKKRLKPYANRLKQIKNGEVVSKSTKEAIDAMVAVVIFATMWPAMMSTIMPPPSSS